MAKRYADAMMMYVDDGDHDEVVFIFGIRDTAESLLIIVNILVYRCLLSAGLGLCVELT